MSKITVLMTAFNSENTITESLESILNQTYSDFQLMIVDDGSEDQTVKKIQLYKDNRICLIESSHVGRARALNLGLKEAKNRYIAILDADDIALPNRLSSQLEVMEAEDVCLVSSNAFLIDSEDIKYGETNFGTTHEELISNIFRFNPFPHSSVLFEKNQVLNFGGYNERCLKSLDFNLYLDLLKENKKFIGIKESLINLKVYSSSWGVSDNKSYQFFYATLGLAAYLIYKKNGFDIMRNEDKYYEVFEGVASEWFYSSNLYKKIRSRKNFRKSLELAKKFNFKSLLKVTFQVLRDDPSFFVSRGKGFSPHHIEEFIQYASHKSIELKNIFNNEK